VTLTLTPSPAKAGEGGEPSALCAISFTRSLAAVLAVLDVFLGVVPGAATGGHGDGDENARDDGAEQSRAECLGPVTLNDNKEFGFALFRILPPGPPTV